ncbi:MAG: tetratricopeptide repeat-containing sulfotransferase family protein [Planctomycetota bacterium]|jgi:tetratricopeptide (TPR) repeat protein
MSAKKNKRKKLRRRLRSKQAPKRRLPSGESLVDVTGEFQKAMRHQQHGQLKRAEAAFKRILKTDPYHADALHLLGLIAYQTGRVNMATDLMSRSIRSDPNNSLYYNNLGNVFKDLRRIDEAISCYQKAIQLNPYLPGAYHNMGDALQNRGESDQAISCYRKALDLKPDFAEAFYSLAMATKWTYEDSQELINLAEQMEHMNITEDGLTNVYFGLGKTYDDLRSYEKAFKYYRRANQLERRRREFKIESHADYVSRTIETYSPDFINERQSWGIDSEMPIFIVGMPRSGTTLVEQIISSHPNVLGAGESEFFSQLEHKLTLGQGSLDCSKYLASIDSVDARNISESYLKHMGTLGESFENKSRITDKTPQNFFFLGLIHLLFPKARFVHCQRNPLDNCLSVYFRKFLRGHDYAYDLTEIGQYYAEYERLMDHWHNVLPTETFEVRYEELVRGQEEISRELINFCGLEWDSRCLDFYRNKRSVFTCMWQVRQPMYTSSTERWKHYVQFLDELGSGLNFQQPSLS